MSYAMGKIAAGLLTAWVFGYMMGILWKAFQSVINAAISDESE